jgi:hypothetical protein
MKKLLAALFLCCCLVLVGCKNNNPPAPPPQPQPVPVNPTPVPAPNRITEVDNGKTFAVKNGSTLTFVLTVASSDDYFWAFSKLDGDFEVLSDTRSGNFEVLSDTRSGNFQTLTVKVGSSGALGLQYSQLAFGVQAQ